MDERHFSRHFPPELEHKILSLLGQLDLTRAALVCRRFRDMSESSLFRHIASWSVHLDEKGRAVKKYNWHRAVFRILDDVALGRHVRFFEVSVTQISRTAEPGRARPLNSYDLHTLWSSMPGLIALSVNGWMPNGQDLGLQNIDFPRLQRLRLDRADLGVEFLQRHLPRLKQLRVQGFTNIPVDCDLTVGTLVHYEGPYLLLVQLLPDGAPTHSLESCRLVGEFGSGIPPTLAPLARYQNLRYLSICPYGADRAMILEMIRDCPPFTSVTSLYLDFDNQEDLDIVPASTDPPWSQLMRPFPAAIYIVLSVDMEYNVVRERGLAWAKEISETCEDATVIVLSDFGFKRAGPSFDWVADDDAEDAIDASLNPPVVHPVPR
ncbi:hypothetical protein EXIGLDRAFT_726618 [Exidia glandulosa HHB12029]|uniref:F-box domain-containing protein n=1 Tax=Exidia glandulosa HHB12029 TaxID=1314781 RepID=A0A165DMX9_EXIGL|nr:hypothetical protein EXIGLDRAFT_726618 [Exidia glandulosa HHB12029]